MAETFAHEHFPSLVTASATTHNNLKQEGEVQPGLPELLVLCCHGRVSLAPSQRAERDLEVLSQNNQSK